jgi:hypothetical protein
VVGVRFLPSHVPADEILSKLRPILDSLYENDKPTFSVETVEVFSATITTEQGYKYTFDQDSFAVSFNHRVRAKPTSGGLPVLELLSKAAPYTELLDQVTDRLLEAIDLVSIKGRLLRRIGIVSVTAVDMSDAPPGIVRLIDQLSSPFGGPLELLNSVTGTTLSATDNTKDRCLHTFAVPEQEDALATLQFDWQRRFLGDYDPLANSDIGRALKHARDDALLYFERVAEGGLSDVANSDS